MAATSINVRVRARYVWWAKFVLKVASVFVRVPGCRWLVRLILLACWMQIRTEDPKGNLRSKLNTPWHWMRVQVEDQRRQQSKKVSR